MQDQRTAKTDRAWAFDLVLEQTTKNREQEEAKAASERKQPVAKTNFGDEWYRHTAAVRVTMAGEPGTNMTYGVGPDGLTLLAARRSDVTDSSSSRRMSRSVAAISHE